MNKTLAMDAIAAAIDEHSKDSKGPIYVFMDPPAGLTGDHAALFRDHGLEAYGMIHITDQQERIVEDDSMWDRILPLKSGSGEDEQEDSEIDLGADEPDEYGED